MENERLLAQKISQLKKVSLNVVTDSQSWVEFEQWRPEAGEGWAVEEGPGVQDEVPWRAPRTSQEGHQRSGWPEYGSSKHHCQAWKLEDGLGQWVWAEETGLKELLGARDWKDQGTYCHKKSWVGRRRRSYWKAVDWEQRAWRAPKWPAREERGPKPPNLWAYRRAAEGQLRTGQNPEVERKFDLGRITLARWDQ